MRDVALEVKLGTLRNQALAAFLAAAFDAVAAGFCGHACAETVLLLAGGDKWSQFCDIARARQLLRDGKGEA